METCHEHTGCIERIRAMEEDVKTLFNKWDSMQKMLVGTLISAILSFVGVVVMLITKL